MIAAATLLLSPVFASAGIVTYTDQAAWEAASQATASYDFNSDVNGSFTTKDFGDFEARLIHSQGYSPAITGGELRLQLWNSNSELDITFDSAINAFGFDWRNTDGSGDDIEIIIDGQSITFGPDRQSGFFGIIADDAFLTASFSDTAGNGGALQYAYLDNFQYGVTSVSAPATLALFGLGLAGIAAGRRRK